MPESRYLLLDTSSLTSPPTGYETSAFDRRRKCLSRRITSSGIAKPVHEDLVPDTSDYLSTPFRVDV
ncbi:hypothetical protein TNCV_5129201 [Trichonephila clavipes]|nr:hypothetical protein TNCV_5129201 [Trichonephila clavipes]